MKNLAIYIRVICILLCVTVIAGVGLSIASGHRQSEGTEADAEQQVAETVKTDIVQQATETVKTDTTQEEAKTTQQSTVAASSPRTGSLRKGRASRTLTHSAEEHTLYIGDKTKPAIALTFDDGPSWEPTTRILDVLEAYDARATFFTMGYKVKTFSEQYVREHALRCEVANHSYNHPKFTQLSKAKVKKQITRTSNLVEELIGEKTHLVRPPYGAYNNTVLEQINAPVIMWSIDTKDWKTRNADKTVANVLGNVKDGDIILMHDVYEPTAEAVERLVPELIARGYQLVTVPELAVLKGEKLKKGQIYNRIPAE